MDNETKEMLKLLLKGQEELRQGQEELRQNVNSINLKLENVIEPKIQLIYENQINIIDYNKKAEQQENRIENLENDVFALKYAFKALKQG